MRLDKEERVKIEQLRRQTRDKKQHVRLSVLVMLDEGYTHEVIAVSQELIPIQWATTSESIFSKDSMGT